MLRVIWVLGLGLLIFFQGVCTAADALQLKHEFLEKVHKLGLSDVDGELRRLAGYGISPEELVPGVTGLLAENQPFVRLMAAQMLWSLGPKGVDAVLSQTMSQDVMIRRYVMVGLWEGAFTPAGKNRITVERIIQAHVRGMHDPDAEVRHNAIHGLEIGGVDANERIQALTAALGEAQGTERIAIAKAMIYVMRSPGLSGKPFVWRAGVREKAKGAVLALAREYLKADVRVALQLANDLGPEGAELAPLFRKAQQEQEGGTQAVEFDSALRQLQPPKETQAKGKSPEPTFSLERVLAGFCEDDIPGNALASWQELAWHETHYTFDALRQHLANARDPQQRRMIAAVLVRDPYTTASAELVELHIANLQTGTLAQATQASIDWLVQTRLQPPLKLARDMRLKALVQGEDSQGARLAAMVLQHDQAYRPTPAELSLLSENLGEDGIPGNAGMALEILGRMDIPEKKDILEKALHHKDEQIAGRAAYILTSDPKYSITRAVLHGLIQNLKLMDGIDQEITDGSIERIGKAQPPFKKGILEKALVEPGQTQRYQRRIARLLVAMPGDALSAPLVDFLISELTEDNTRGNAGEALQALMAHRNPTMIRKLEQTLDSPDRQQRLFAAEILPKLHEYKPKPPSRLIEVTLENLNNEYLEENDPGGWDIFYWYNAGGTAQYLIDHPTLATKELEDALDSTDTQRRWLAAMILGATGRGHRIQRIVEILMPELKQDGSPVQAGYCLRGLGPQVIPYLKKYENDPDEVRRFHIKLLIEDIRHPPAHMNQRELFRRDNKFGMNNWEYLLNLPDEHWFYNDTTQQ